LVVAEGGHEQVRDEGLKFRVEVACDGYANLTESDVPDSVVCDEDYLQGARDAAEGIRSALEAT